MNFKIPARFILGSSMLLMFVFTSLFVPFPHPSGSFCRAPCFNSGIKTFKGGWPRTRNAGATLKSTLGTRAASGSVTTSNKLRAASPCLRCASNFVSQHKRYMNLQRRQSRWEGSYLLCSVWFKEPLVSECASRYRLKTV